MLFVDFLTCESDRKIGQASIDAELDISGLQFCDVVWKSYLQVILAIKIIYLKGQAY